LGVECQFLALPLRLTHHKGHTVITYAVNTEVRKVFVLGVFCGGQDLERALSTALKE